MAENLNNGASPAQAGRGTAREKRERDRRRDERRSRDSNIPEDADTELREAIQARDQKITQLNFENSKLRAEHKITELFSKEEFKTTPEHIKLAIKRTPFVFVQPDSREIEDMVMDVEDYLLDIKAASPSNPPAQAGLPAQAGNEGNNQDPKGQSGTGYNPQGNPNSIPPANNSGHTPQKSEEDLNAAGKTGSARSVAVLKGLFKKAGVNRF